MADRLASQIAGDADPAASTASRGQHTETIEFIRSFAAQDDIPCGERARGQGDDYC